MPKTNIRKTNAKSSSGTTLPKKTAGKDKKRNKYRKILWGIFASLVGLVALLFIFIASGVFGFMPTFEDLENPESSLASEIISADQQVIGTYYVENRTNAEFNELSPYLIQALIATEDSRFYTVFKRAVSKYKTGRRLSRPFSPSRTDSVLFSVFVLTVSRVGFLLLCHDAAEIIYFLSYLTIELFLFHLGFSRAPLYFSF